MGYTIIVKFGERGLARKCSEGYTRGELVRHVCSKWEGITSEEIFLSYDLLGLGELDLADDDDMVTMFRLMDEMETRRVNVYVRRLAVGMDNGNVCRSSNYGKDILQIDEGASDVDGINDAEVVGMTVQKLRSDEWRHLISGPGQRFCEGAKEFRRALIKYSVQMGFEFRFLKNDTSRVTAVCSKSGDGCPWRIHAVSELPCKSFRISTYERNHTCDSVFGNVSRKRINYHIITEIILEDVRSMPCLTPVQIKAMVKKNYGVDISYCVAWKAMDKGRSIVFGDHSTSFAMLPIYFAELVKANPGSHVHLDVGDDNKFRRCFFAFGACLLGFKQCRPLLMVDGTFLKGRHRGVLLSAVGKDGDEGTVQWLYSCVL